MSSTNIILVAIMASLAGAGTIGCQNDSSGRSPPAKGAHPTHANPTPGTLWSAAEQRRLTPALIHGSRHPKQETRAAALQSISRLGTREAEFYLRRALRDPDSTVRRWALVGLSVLGPRTSVRSVDAMAAALAAEPTPALRALALRALARTRHSHATEVLAAALSNPPAGLTISICDALFPDKEPPDPGLLAQVRKTLFGRGQGASAPDQPVAARTACLRALTRAGNPRLSDRELQRLQSWSRGRDVGLRTAACGLLPPEHLIRCSEDADWRVAAVAFPRLLDHPALFQNAASRRLLKIQLGRSSNWRHELAVLRSWMGVSRATLQGLQPALAASGQAVLNDPKLRPMTCDLTLPFHFQDTFEYCGSAAPLLRLESLARRGLADAANPFFRELKRATHPNQILMLNRWGAAMPSAQLVRYLQSSQLEVRIAATRAVRAKPASPELGASLLSIPQDDSAAAALAWLEAFEHHQPATSPARVHALSSHPVLAVRAQAIDILAQRGSLTEFAETQDWPDSLSEDVLDAQLEATRIVLATSKGPLRIELFPQIAPGTVTRFMRWARAGADAQVLAATPGTGILWQPQTAEPQHHRSEWSDTEIGPGSLSLEEIRWDVPTGRWRIHLLPNPAGRGQTTVFGKVVEEDLERLLEFVPGDRIDAVQR